MVKKISQLILKSPRINIIILFIITIFFIILNFRIKFDTSLSAFVIRNDKDLLYYEKIKSIFDTDETLIIGFKARDLFSYDDLALIKKMSTDIGRIDGVRNVRSLTNANLITTTADSFAVEALVKDLPKNEQESLTIKKEATTNYIYLKDLLSENGEYGSLLVDIRNISKEKTKQVVEKIKRYLNLVSKQTSIKFYLGGDAIIHYALGEYIKRDFFNFLFPTYVVLTILLFLTMPYLKDILVSLVAITISLIWTMGSISLLGKTFNNVTVGIMPLILCIALEDIYYLHNYYYRYLEKYNVKKIAWQKAIKEVIGPCFFTSFTTVIGFISLMANNIKPIIDFGLVGSLAIMLAFIIAIILIPSAHLILPVSKKNIHRRFLVKVNLERFLTILCNFIVSKKKYIGWGVFAVLAFSLLGISFIKIETDHLKFFHKKSSVFKAVQFIENNLAGTSNLEVIVEANQPDRIKDLDVLKQIDKLVNFIRRQSKVDKAISIVDFLKEMNKAMYDNKPEYYSIPNSRQLVAQYLLVYSMSPRRNDVESDFVDYMYKIARIRCRISEHNSKKILNLINQIKQFAQNEISSDLTVKITSYPVIYSNMVDSLAQGQLKCLIIVFFSLLIATSVYFKSLKIGLLAMLPNVIPITFTLGFMGFMGITLNIATAMTAGIAIGLAMDDTTHFLSYFRKHYSGDNYPEEVKKVIFSLGEPMIFSSLLMISGYLILIFSQFRLTVFFGFLCALTIFIALLSDLIVTPWLLIVFRPYSILIKRKGNE